MPFSDSHEYRAPEPDASRSPCPALNAAAAHGFLPHSGRNITFLQLFKSIRAIYNVSFPLALVLSVGGFLACGRGGRPSIPFFGTIDLHDLARHGRIEHDGSLAHADAEPGQVFAPVTPNKELLDGLLSEANGKDYLNIQDLGRARNKRDALLAEQGRQLDTVHAAITRGELGFILLVLGNGKEVPTQRIVQWMYEDRLPDGWTRPEKTRGLIEVLSTGRKIIDSAKQEEGAQDTSKTR